MAGIGSREGASPVIRNNRCYKNEMAGIGSRLGARPVIVDNQCYENKMAGIGTREGSTPIICRNRSYKNEMAGIGSRDGGRPIIVQNKSRENKMAGIGVRTDSKAIIIGNQCIENRLVAIGVPDGATAFIHGNELIRTGGGAPPLVALRGGAKAVVSDNLIRGGGVAGILVQGTAHILGNRFEGRGPEKQGSAIWVPFGGAFKFKSTIVVATNECVGYRNLLNAANCDATVVGNKVRNFRGAAIIVRKTTAPARVLGNRAFSDQEKDAVVSLEGGKNLSHENKLEAAKKFKSVGPSLWTVSKKAAETEVPEHLQKIHGPATVTDGPWKLVVTRDRKTAYKLLNSELDSTKKKDFSKLAPHLAFRLRGLRERLEAEAFQKSLKGANRR